MALCTIAKWLKETLRLAGSDVSIFFRSFCERSFNICCSTSWCYHEWHYAGSTLEPWVGVPKVIYRPSHDTTMAGQYFLHLRMRPEHLCVICLVMGYGWLDFTCYGGATNNTIDMWDWAFWNIITKWLRSQSDCMLFVIIWRRWSQAYQWSHPPLPTHTNRFANSKVEGAKTWWLFIGQFLCMHTVAICLFICSQVLFVTCYYYYPCLYDNQQ